MLLSFERPAHRRRSRGYSRELPGGELYLFPDLENCTVANVTGIGQLPNGNCLRRNPCGFLRAGIAVGNPEKSSDFSKGLPQGFPDHRQDIKGTWWMPWHQESTKGVNGCDKPR